MTKRKILIIGLVLITLTAISSVLYIMLNQTNSRQEVKVTDKNTPNTATDILDKDTEEHYDPATPKLSTGWTDPRDNSVHLFGTSKLSDMLYDKRSHIGNILDDIKSALYDFGDIQLNKKYETLTIIPDSIVIDTDSVKSNIRLGQTEEIMSMSARVITSDNNTLHAHVTIQNSKNSETVFEYAGGLTDITKKGFSITQKYTDTLTLVIDGGSREAALRFISSIGYKVPDFTIIFTKYESPFNEG